MAPLTPQQALAKLRTLYRDAYKHDPANDQVMLDWAAKPDSWATCQVRHFGWSFLAAEAVVRQCRILLPRAARAAEEAAA